VGGTCSTQEEIENAILWSENLDYIIKIEVKETA
jgi:hypothetical protein